MSCCRAIKLRVTAVKSAGDCFQIGQLQLWHTPAAPPSEGVDLDGPSVEVPTEGVTVAVSGTAPGGGGTGSEVPENLLLPGLDWCKWYNPYSTGTAWVTLSLPKPRRITGYALTSANDCPERDPRSWTLQGQSPETGDWVDLHSVEGHSFASRHQRVQWDFESDGEAYSEIRLNITEIRTVSSGVQLNRIQLYALEADDE